MWDSGFDKHIVYNISCICWYLKSYSDYEVNDVKTEYGKTFTEGEGFWVGKLVCHFFCKM